MNFGVLQRIAKKYSHQEKNVSRRKYVKLNERVLSFIFAFLLEY
jgi:hypothetical protein